VLRGTILVYMGVKGNFEIAIKTCYEGCGNFKPT
jgi:hypothetical protein